MGIEQKTNQPPESCDECPRWQNVKQQRLRLAKLLHKACEGLESQLNASESLELKIPDYLKLLEFEKNFEDQTEQAAPKEIRVVWVDRDPASNGQ
jgi:hypothetical protein